MKKTLILILFYSCSSCISLLIGNKQQIGRSPSTLKVDAEWKKKEPPRIQMATRISTPNDKLLLEGEIFSYSPLRGISVNGFDVIQKVDDNRPNYYNFKYLVTNLAIGENKISIEVTSSAIERDFSSLLVTIRRCGGSIKCDPSLYVLTIGINNFFDKKMYLPYSYSDSEKIADIFKTQKNNISFKDVYSKFVEEKDQTLSGIKNKIYEFTEFMYPEDYFVFFISTHGVTQGNEYYLYLNDTKSIVSGLESHDLYKALSNSQANKLILIDACGSGNFRMGVHNNNFDKETLDKFRQVRDLQLILASASKSENASQSSELESSFFAQSIIDCFTKKGDINNDNCISFSEIKAYLEKSVSSLSKKQQEDQTLAVIYESLKKNQDACFFQLPQSK